MSIRMISNGYEVFFLMTSKQVIKTPEKFFKNKLYLYDDHEYQVWTYSHRLPNLLIQGLPYGGIPARKDFYSTNQTELLKFMNLCQREEGLSLKGIPGKILLRGGSTVTKKVVNRIPEINDIIDKKMISDFNFESINNGDVWSGTYDVLLTSDLAPEVLSTGVVNRAVNTGGITLINGLPTGIQNLHIGKIAPSEGYAIIDGENSVYIPNNISDIEGILDLLTLITSSIVSCTSFPNPLWPGVQTSLLTAIATQKNTLK